MASDDERSRRTGSPRVPRTGAPRVGRPGAKQPRVDAPRSDKPRSDKPRDAQPRTDAKRVAQPRGADGQRASAPRTADAQAREERAKVAERREQRQARRITTASATKPGPQSSAPRSAPARTTEPSARTTEAPARSSATSARSASRGAVPGRGKATHPASSARPAAPHTPRRLIPLAKAGRPRRRSTILSIAACVVLTVFAGRLVYIQAFEADALANEASQQLSVTKQVPAERGVITDAQGVVLATSVARYDVTVNQAEIAAWKHTVDGVEAGGPVEAARLTSDLLGIDAAELAAEYTGTRKFKYIKKEVLPEVWDAIVALGIHGLYGEKTTKRVYPSGSLAGNIVGFVGTDDEGKAGIESSLNSELSGSAGEITYERARSGHVIPAGKQESSDAVAGSDVELTVIRDIQYVAEQALSEQVKKFGATGGTVIVMDTKTGAVYALAESNAVDPNDPSASKASDRGSKAASNVFEPGSTAKVITMAALLETGADTPTSKFTVKDRFTTQNGQTFKDSHDHATEKWTLTGILSNSSNTGTVMAGGALTKQVRYDYLKKFGFGAKTGVELGGESNGILHNVEDWDGRTEHTVLFGQGVAVTEMQAISVYATIANGGKRVTPHLVNSVVAADGTKTETAPTVGEQVVSAKTSKQLLRMLESTVIDGTGKQAAISGYRVAGKTGTAQAANSKGQMTDIVASFMGVVPAENPRLAISVVLNNPSASVSIYGGAVAGPVFAKVGAYALQNLGIEPSSKAAKLYKENW